MVNQVKVNSISLYKLLFIQTKLNKDYQKGDNRGEISLLSPIFITRLPTEITS